MNDKRLNLAKVKDIIENKMPANKLFGLVVVKIDVGYVKLHVPFKKEFIGDAMQNLWHGGILASITDTAVASLGRRQYLSPKTKLTQRNWYSITEKLNAYIKGK